MKRLLVTCALLISFQSMALVNLDHPVSIGIGDRYFKSSVDPKVVYTIPVGLYRTSRYFMKKEGDRLKTEFMMGLFPDQIKAVQSKVNRIEEGLKLRVFRAIEAHYIGEAADIPREFEPKLHGGGAFENLMGPTHVFLETKKNARVHWYHIFPLSAKKLIREVFGRRFSEQIFGDHIGSIEYSFSAVSAGEKRLAKTRIGIYTSESHMDIYGEQTPVRLKNALNTLSTAEAHELIPGPSSKPVPMKITDDNKTPCWDTELEIGEFCLGQSF